MISRHRLPAAWSAGAAVLWVVLASRTPTSTHHFAPLIIAVAWGAVLHWADGPPASSNERWIAFAGGFALALAAYVVLLSGDWLRGPALIDPIATKVELPLFAIGGALAARLGGQSRRA